MCRWGDSVKLTLIVPAEHSSTRLPKYKIVDVDRCLAPLVRLLNDNGFPTVASCCGHGKRPGNIMLADGREVFIVPDHETARKVDALLNTAGLADPIN